MNEQYTLDLEFAPAVVIPSAALLRRVSLAEAAARTGHDVEELVAAGVTVDEDGRVAMVALVGLAPVEGSLGPEAALAGEVLGRGTL